MCPGILTEHGFKHKGNHYATLPWSGTKKDQNKYSGFRRDVKRHVLGSHFRATSGQNVLYMRSDVSKEIHVSGCRRRGGDVCCLRCLLMCLQGLRYDHGIFTVMILPESFNSHVYVNSI